jgi:hypothetical protein
MKAVCRGVKVWRRSARPGTVPENRTETILPARTSAFGNAGDHHHHHRAVRDYALVGFALRQMSEPAIEANAGARGG